MLWHLLFSCIAAATAVLGETEPIAIQGSKFLRPATGEQFILKGLHYSLTTDNNNDDSNDPLANPTACKRDIPYFESLGINTISVYTVDATADHDECMRLLDNAGIYVIPYLNPLTGLDTGNVTWTTEDFAAQTALVDAFVGYENVLAFFFQVDSTLAAQRAAGNRNETEGSALFSAYAKSVVRDVKAYIASKENRKIPVGYATRATELMEDEINYFTCGDQEERVDILGIRSESWCAGSTFASSGWEDLTDELWFPSVPVVMAEYYCADPEDRDEEMGDVAALYGEEMAFDWSGGMFYTYAGSDYGLVEINNGKVTESPAFDTFASILSSSDHASTNDTASSPSYYTTCSYKTPFPEQPPQPDAQYCDCTLRHSLCTPLSTSPSTLDALWEDICSTSTDLCRRRPNDNYAGEYGDYSMCNATVELAALLSDATVDDLGTGSGTCGMKWGENVGYNPLYGSWTNGRGPRTCGHRPIGAGPSGEDQVDQRFRSGTGWHRTSVLFIVLIVLAGVIVIALIAITVCCVRRRRRRRRAASAAVAAGTATGADAGAGAAASEVAQGKQPERPDLQSDFAETAEGSLSAPMATGGLGGESPSASASGSGRATTIMPMEFFAPGPGEERAAR
ncbi:Glucanosyltransferase-domain-containing protein, partial [Aspergillus pseudodeflectus]